MLERDSRFPENYLGGDLWRQEGVVNVYLGDDMGREHKYKIIKRNIPSSNELNLKNVLVRLPSGLKSASLAA